MITVLLAGASAVFFQYRAALGGWFLREDSRYFSNGLFSFWDLWLAFSSPQNVMGHFRPVTKLLWGVPEWLGFFSPFAYHCLSFALLAAAAAALMRLAFLLHGEPLVAALTGILWALMPVNAKPVYWFSACQDLACALFVFSMLAFRLEQWRRPARERAFRRLFLFCLAGALCSREVGFTAVALVPVLDAWHGKLRRSWEALLPAAALAAWIFVLNPPFARTHLTIDPGVLFSSATFLNFRNYALATFWAPADGAVGETPLWIRAGTCAVFGMIALGGFFRRELRFCSGLAAAGIAPFLLINVFSIEYAFVFGGAVALGAGALLAGPARRVPPFAAAAACVAITGAYLGYLGESRAFYREAYVGHSILLRDLFAQLGRDTRALPPYRPITIADVGPLKDSPARDTYHFIASGIDELIPDRVLLVSRDTLGIPDFTFLHDPALPFWGRTFPRLETPVSLRYTGRGFTHD